MPGPAENLPIPIPDGYILVPRYLRRLTGHLSPSAREVFLYLLESCNHKDQVSSGRVIKRGQCVRSYEDIIEELAWFQGWRKCRYTKSILEAATKSLKKAGLVAIRKTTKGMIISVINYDAYQNPKSYENHKENQTGDHRLATPVTTDSPHHKQEINERNKLIKKQESPAAFFSPPTDDGEGVLSPELTTESSDRQGSRHPAQWNEFISHVERVDAPLAGILVNLDAIEDGPGGTAIFIGNSRIIKQLNGHRVAIEQEASNFFGRPVEITLQPAAGAIR